MKNIKGFSILALALSGLILAGCENTAEGMSQDAESNREALAEGAEATRERAGEAWDDTKAAGENAVAARLTPIIKSAFIANPVLNKDDVVIDVDTDSERVVLRGVLQNHEQHDMALKIAKEVIEKDGDGQRLVDELTVSESSQ